ncbi:hypothetical protein [Mycobacterium sp. IS-836]|uniref:hypothetical protein n=1 Tax=Mycobacterium sp. IS-836 TaxID=1834160 RepID=UPI0018EA0720|nr:hypothetical protein [Mycobacterium sp. IS-836]
MKALGIAVAAVLAFAPFSVITTAPGVAQAAPCAGAGADPGRCQYCQFLVGAYHTSNGGVCSEDPAPRPAQAPPSRVPVPLPAAPAPPVPVNVPSVPTPEVVPPSPPSPTTVAVQTPKIPPNTGVPGGAAVVTPPKGLDASPQAIAAAKNAPATRVNPGTAHQMQQLVDFNRQVQNVVNAHGGNVDVVKADNQTLARPRHWDYLDYDTYHRPSLYNPLNQAMTFRFTYNGAAREAYVPAGGRVVLDIATAGLFPFTAVGDSYVASGSFYGGAWIPPDGWSGPPPPSYTPPAPEAYQDVSVAVPAAAQTVQVGQVGLVGHDASQPAGSQDTFLLDDTTLAWGQINDPGSSAQIKVTKTQSLPGVGPTDNGSYLVALTAQHDAPAQPSEPWWPIPLRFGGFALVVGLVAWVINRRRRAAEPTAGP